MVIGPAIADAGGVGIDQNGNFIDGEIPLDQYKAAFTLADIIHVSGTINEDTTWQGITIVDDEVTVPDGVTLTIDPGVIVKFDPARRCGITVQTGGIFIAQGSVAQPITFTSLDDDAAGGDVNIDGAGTTPAAGDWLGIHAVGGNATLDHAIISYGGGTTDRIWNSAAGAVTVQNDGAVTLTNSMIRAAFYEGVKAWGSGTVIVENSVITGTDRGVNADGNSTVTLTNCTLDDNRIGIYGHNGELIVTNSIISNSISAGIHNILNSSITLKYSNVWSLSGSNYLGNITDRTGTDGNVSVEPRYRDTTGDSYQLDYVSPMIDAADGTAAPTTDYMGAPRYDDPRTTDTGIATAAGEFADMGAFEFVETAASPLDLIVSRVAGPATVTAGEQATVSWTVKNIGSEPVTGPWHDALLLVAEAPTRGVTELKLAETLADATIGPGESVDFTSEIQVAGGTEGPWRWHVKTNVNGEVFEGINWTNNAGPLSDQVELSVPELVIDTAHQGEYFDAEQPAWFKITQPAGEEILITLDGQAEEGRSRIYAGFGSMPTAEDFELRSAWSDSPDARLNLPAVDNDRTVYLLITQETPAADKSYTITAAVAEFSIDSINLKQAGNTGNVTITIWGSFFNNNLAARLRATDATGEINAIQVLPEDSGTAFATFDLKGAPTGTYDVVILQDGMERVLSAAFTVVQGGGGILETRLFIPENVRIGRPFQGVVEYTNAGNADMPVPLIILRGSADNPVWLDGGCDSCGWDEVHFLAIPTDRPNNGVLPPGATYSIIIYSVNWQATAGYALFAKYGDSTDPVDWPAIKNKIWPAAADTLWEQAWNTVTAAMGDTYGEYIAALAATADEARRHGLELTAVTDLLTYNMRQELNYLPDAAITGAVTHAGTGQSPGNETVTAVNLTTEEAYLTQTWYAGVFSFRDLPAGNYLVQVDNSASGTWNEVVVPEAGGSSDVTLSFLPGVTVSGRVVSAADNAPIDNASVIVVSLFSGDTYLAQTDENGRYEINGIPASSFTVEILADNYLAPGVQTIEPGDEETVGFSIALEAGGGLQGHILDTDGIPAGEATVRALPRGTGPGQLVVTSTTGSYEITGLAAGLYDLEADLPGYGAVRLENIAVAAGTTSSGTDLTLQTAGSVRINVTDAVSKQPIVDASITSDAPGYRPDPLVSAAEGVILFSDLPPGEHTLWISAQGYLTSETTVTIVGGEESQLSVSLQAAGDIIGVVRNNAGENLADMPVTLFWHDTPAAMAWSGADGAFGFHGLPDGEYTLALGNGAGHVIGRQTISLTANNNTEDVSMTVDLTELSGTVYRPGGTQPADDVSVSLLRNGQLVDTICTDEQGRYGFQVLREGLYDVIAMDGSIGFVNRHDVAVVAGQPSTGQDLIAGDASLSVSISAPAAPATAGNSVQVIISPAGGWAGPGGELWFFSRVGGSVSINNLTPGDYDILVSSDTLASQRYTVSVGSAGAQLDVVMAPGRILQGTVIDSDGKPIPGAFITLLQTGSRPELIAATDGSGAYICNSLPAGSFNLLINDLSRQPVLLENIDFSGPAPHIIETTLAGNGYSISGRVADAQDRPLLGVGVSVSSPDGVLLFKGVSRSNGEYDLGPVAAGIYKLTFHDWGLVTETQEITINADYDMGTVVLEDPITIDVPASANTTTAAANSMRITAAAAGLSYLDRLNAFRDYVPAMFGGRLEEVQGRKLFQDLQWMLGDKMPPPQRHAIDTNEFRDYYISAWNAFLKKRQEDPNQRFCNEVEDAYKEATVSRSSVDFSFRLWLNAHKFLESAGSQTVAIAATKGLANALDVSLTFIAWQKDWLNADVLKGMINGTDVSGVTISAEQKSKLARELFLGLKTFVYDPLAILTTGLYDVIKKGDWQAADPYIVKISQWAAGVAASGADFMVETGLEKELIAILGSAEGKKVAEKFQLGIFSKIKDVIGVVDKLVKYHNETKKDVDKNIMPGIEQWWKMFQGYDKAWRKHREKTLALTRAIKKCEGENFNVPPPPAGLHNLNSQSTNGLGSLDPNEKYTVGFGAPGFVAPDSTILYTIVFENKTTAAVPAQEVNITDQLAAGLDWSTFQLVSIGFNKVDINIPPGLQSFTRDDITVATDSNPVHVHAALNPATGVVTWLMTSVDPVTGSLPDDPFAGFLPPNDDEHRGEGYVTFKIQPEAGQAGGSSITNQASIVFDVNEPILTPVAVNTIDAAAPVSSVQALAADSSPSFEVRWSADDGSGSGPAVYAIYVQDNSGAFETWLSDTTAISAQFAGRAGHTYGFFSLATDGIGLTEALKNAPEATTTIRITRGDLNGDETIGLADAILVMQVMADIVPATPAYKEYDVSGDEKIGISEAIYIMQALAGRRTP